MKRLGRFFVGTFRFGCLVFGFVLAALGVILLGIADDLWQPSQPEVKP